MSYVIKIIDTATGEVVRTLIAANERQADRMESGANINLDHGRFHTHSEEVEE